LDHIVEIYKNNLDDRILGAIFSGSRISTSGKLGFWKRTLFREESGK